MTALQPPAPAFDVSVPCAVHIVGLGGAGMSAIASVLVALGHRVSGSDLKDSAVLERLRSEHVRVDIGHDPAHVAGASFLAISSAISESNVEVRAAKAAGISVLSRAALLAALSRVKVTITVAGTHGKTTTTSMLALILIEAGLRPSFVIGGEVNEIGSNAAWQDGEHFVVEADESDGTFLELSRDIAILTSLEADHLEHYGSFAALIEATAAYVEGARRGSVLCADDARVRALARPTSLTYGFSEQADLRIVDFVGERARIAFGLERDGHRLGAFVLPVPGEHNARNAAAAVASAVQLGVSPEVARRALARFAGVSRRFEFRGELHGASLIDDYAHLPGEIAATIAAARQGDWTRVVVVFQPHRYSRVEALWQDFADAFRGADLLVLTSVYPAGEAPRPGISAKLILDAVLAAHPLTEAVYLPERTELVEYLRAELRAGDCCLCLSAGDLTTLPDELRAGA